MGQGIKGGSSFLRRSTAQFKTVTSRLALFNIQALTTTARTRALSAGGSIKTFGRTLFSLAGRVIPIAINGFRALSVAVLANPVGLAIAGIAAGAFLIIKYWKPLGAFFGKLFGGVWEKAKKLFGWIFPQFKLIGALWKKFRGFFGKKDKGNTEAEAQETKRPGDTIAKKSRPKSPRAPMPPGFQPSAVQTYSPKPQRPPLPIQRAGMATAPPKPATMPPSNGQTTINVYPKEGQSEARIAEEVMRRMEQNRGRRLHD
ncbi:MAG: hypothetical protein MI742_05915 [Desulfobacterales bacterium]|nr:hypothetical protein [Desulfobacterales bacterium]